MKNLFISIVAFGLVFMCLTVKGNDSLRQAALSETMPDHKDYTFMWWAYGFNPDSAADDQIVCFQTGRYGMAINPKKAEILNLGLIPDAKPASEAALMDNDVVFSLPKAALKLVVQAGDKKYVCTGSSPKKEEVYIGSKNAFYRIINSGRFVQRADIIGLVFEDENKNQLDAQCRLEITAWPGKLFMFLEVIPNNDLADAQLDIELDQNVMKAVKTASANGTTAFAAGQSYTASLVLSADEKNGSLVSAGFAPDAITVTNMKDNQPITGSLDASRGWFYIPLPETNWEYTATLEYTERLKITLKNNDDFAKQIPLAFGAEYLGHMTGLVCMIRDKDGNPTGIPVQISKNWHKVQQGGELLKKKILYQGDWFNGFTMMHLPPKTTLEFEFTLVCGMWGAVPAASHAQLCLVGWGINQLWDQAAIGNWGESICYDPDINLQRSMIDDIRPLMVSAKSDQPNQKWGWTNNVGGGDFLVYYDDQARKQILTRMRTFYNSCGPNLTDVTYSGITADGNITANIAVSSPRCDDINRAYHRIRYDVLKPTPFNRLAFYQLGADNYNDHQFNKIAIGNSKGLVEEWSPEKGGGKYQRTNIQCLGDVVWFSLHEGFDGRNSGGAWANRGIIIRSWKAKLGGKDIQSPTASVYGTVDQFPSNNIEISSPASLKELLPGDFVEAEIELVVIPVYADDYYGPNENLRQSLKSGQNTWKPVYRQAIGNNLEVNVIRGTLLDPYPVKVEVDKAQSTEFEIKGGIGYVPVTIGGLDKFSGYQLRQVADGKDVKVDQSVYGNDYWQSDYDAVNKKWSITYNIPLDTKDDKPQTRRFILRELTPQETQLPQRLRRSESFLGIHFDFHASKENTRVGENVTRQMVQNIIDKVNPDYIQCDSKGHPGCSSYPTKVGTQAGGFVRDQLRIWRDVTAENGVSLYVHHSGVFDTTAIRNNPDWAQVDKDGKRDENFTSVFGPYVDKLLIPQLKELRSDYGIDGVWVDGECWAMRPDYSQWAAKAFQEKTGITEMPRKPEDAHYWEFLEFCREGFRQYLNHYATELHKLDPQFQICSNWAYSSFMPEPVTTDVDYLSGDASGVNSARFEGRCLAPQGMSWDIMTWGFYHKDNSLLNTKTAVQLQQEAASIISLGGGFQVYFTQNGDGSISDWQMDVMGEVAKFCRERQAICHKAQPVPQIAMLYSREGLYHQITNIFKLPWDYPLLDLQGNLQCLLDSQYSVEILMEHHLSGKMQEYPLIVIPEWDYIGEDFKAQLLAYVDNGGNLLLIGTKPAAMFKEQLGVTFNGEPVKKNQWLESDGRLGSIYTQYQSVTLSASAKPFGKIFTANNFKADFVPAASISQYGKGKIAGVYFDNGYRYTSARTVVAREFINSLVQQLFPQPVVQVTGSHYVDVTVNRIGGRLTVNLVNTAGPHDNAAVSVFDEIPTVGPLDITIRYPEKPKNVTLEPGGKKMEYKHADGQIKLTIPKLEIHEIIVVD